MVELIGVRPAAMKISMMANPAPARADTTGSTAPRIDPSVRNSTTAATPRPAISVADTFGMFTENTSPPRCTCEPGMLCWMRWPASTRAARWASENSPAVPRTRTRA